MKGRVPHHVLSDCASKSLFFFYLKPSFKEEKKKCVKNLCLLIKTGITGLEP